MIIIPGINGSDEHHWQTLWQRSSAGRAFRIGPSSWSDPELEDWLTALSRTFEACKEPPLLLAHSLGSLLVAFWAARHPSEPMVRGAFLVAPPDPQSPVFPRCAPSFREPPPDKLPFPSLVVASSNDPFASLPAAERFALQWGSGFVPVGALGHINSDSNLGDWTQGRHLFEAFRAGTTRNDV
jgi:predicted alpha/beta hydrolase family esterase